MLSFWYLLSLGPLLLFGILAATATEASSLVITRAIVWFAACSLAGSEVLGQFHAISEGSLRAYWFATALALVAAIVVRVRSGHTPHLQMPADLISPYGLWIAVVLVITVAIAATAVPNNGDGLTYHLPRVEHWLQNGTLAFYPTHDDRQNDEGPLAEMIVLQWRAITGGDHLSSLLQWLAMVGSLAAVSLITREFQGGKRSRLLAVLYCATIPMGILQSTSNQTDYVTAFFFIFFVERILAAKETYRPATAAEAALSIALAILTKPTAFIWGFPFGLWFAVPLLGHPRKASLILSIFVIVAGVPAIGHYGRVIATYGTPMPPLSKMTNSASFGIPQTMDAFLLQSASELAVPQNHINAVIMHVINSVSDRFGWSAHRGDTTIGAAIPPSLLAAAGDESLRLPDERLSFDEDYAGNPWHFVFGSLSVAVTLLWLLVGRDRRLGWYGLCCVAGYVLFVSLIRWQPYVTRLHLPLLVAFSPLVGIVAGRIDRLRAIVDFLALVLCVSSWPYLIGNTARPLWPHSFMTNPTAVTLFAGRPSLRLPYVDGIKRVGDLGCRKVGLIADFNAFEFPVWYLLRTDLEKGGRMEQIFPERPDVAYPLGAFHPDCVIDIRRAAVGTSFAFDGATWTAVYKGAGISVFAKSRPR